LGAHELYGMDEVFILPRGSGVRLPWTHEIDVRLGYMLKFDPSYTIAITVDVFNLFNFQQKTGIDQRYTAAAVQPIEDGTKDDLDQLLNQDGTEFDKDLDYNKNFGNPTAYQRPLTTRIGIRATF
jgi:hypothetical protein